MMTTPIYRCKYIQTTSTLVKDERSHFKDKDRFKIWSKDERCPSKDKDTQRCLSKMKDAKDEAVVLLMGTPRQSATHHSNVQHITAPKCGTFCQMRHTLLRPFIWCGNFLLPDAQLYECRRPWVNPHTRLYLRPKGLESSYKPQVALVVSHKVLLSKWCRKAWTSLHGVRCLY